MLRLTRLFFTNSPTELFGILHPPSDPNRVLHWKQKGVHHLRCCSSIALPPTASSPCSPNTLKQRQQWPVNVTRCGIAKEFAGSPATFFEQQGLEINVFGDDACFIATHNSIYVAGTSLINKAAPINNTPFVVPGVADGVGGWRRHGVDPSKFSSQLMANCEEIVRSGEFQLERPDLIIEKAFNKLKTPPHPVGSSTACVLIIAERTLYAANLGDSGYLICRNGKVLYRSPEQTHYFNAPYQLTLLPERFEIFKRKGEYLGDKPENTDLREHKLQPGDLVLIASDGLWDNIPEETVAEILADMAPTKESLQARCNTLALIARHLSNDEMYESPFTKRAKEHGINALGGKPDDVTIVLFYIS